MKIQKDINLKPYNSFGLAQRCAYFAEVENVEELKQALAYGSQHHLPVHILGEGSNTLFVQDYAGLVVHMAFKGIEHLLESAVVKASCGEHWHDLVEYCLKKGLYGLENMALIPGTVGAAPVQNIGAYGVELDQFCLELEVFNRANGKVEKLSREQCGFGYRDSLFKHDPEQQLLVLSLTLQLSTKARVCVDYPALRSSLDGITEPSPQQVFNSVCQIRRSKLPDPAVLGNAGSFFKNPMISREKFEKLKQEHPDLPCYDTEDAALVKVPAAWLLEKAGWKGRRKGDAGVHAEHALVLVNHGQATGEEILLLAQEMSSSVLQNYGIALNLEVRLV